MIRVASPTVSAAAPRQVTSSRVVRLAWVVFCSVPPLFVLGALFASAIQDDVVAFDFRVYYAAAEAVLRGDAPYDFLDDPRAVLGRAYVYPPLTAIGVIPLTVLPLQAAGLLVMAVLAGAVLAIPYVIGVRDWRCYWVILLWPPVISAIQTSNPTLLFVLLAALAWRYRDHRVAAAASLGSTLAVKFVLWPLVVWLAATRRLGSAVLACVIGGLLVLLSWTTIGFAGLTGYPDLLRRLEDAIGQDAYTTYILATDLGVPSTLARALWLALGLLILAAVVWSARRGDDIQAEASRTTTLG